MNNSEQNLIDSLIDGFSHLPKADFISFNGRELEISIKHFPEIETILSELSVEFENLPGDKMSIVLTKNKFKNLFLYYDEEDFTKRCSLSSKDFFKNDITFINPKGADSAHKVTHKQTNMFAMNFLIFKEIQSLFRDTKEFAHFDDRTNRVFTIVSKEYGVFRIGYTQPEYKFFYGINLKDQQNQLRENFEKKEFIQFFKEIIVTSVHNKDEEHRFKTIIRQLESIVNLTLKDYESYVSNFAIDKIKAEFKEERESYFENIDRSINSIEKQVVSFPLTFAASIFGVYKVQEKPGVILLILLAYLMYTVIAVLILRMTSYNVKCLKFDVDSEENAIKNEFGKLFADFADEFKKIRKKIVNLKIILVSLYAVLLCLFVIFAVYAFHTMKWIDIQNFLQILKNNLR